MIREELKSAMGNLLTRYAKGVATEFPEVVKGMMEKPFRAADTGVHPKLLADWNRNGLLLSNHEKNKRHDFSLSEVVWIKLIDKFRQYNVPIEVIKSLRNGLVSKPDINYEDLMANPEVREGIIGMIPEEHHDKLKVLMEQPDFLEQILASLPFDVDQVNAFDSFVIFALVLKKPLSFFLDHDGNGTLFTPLMLEEAAISQQDFQGLMSSSHVAISVTEALAEILGNAPMEKVAGNYGFLTPNEHQVFTELKSNDLLAVTIRFDDNGEMNLLELTENKTVDSRARLMELILKNGYQDITIKTQDGNISVYRNTRKIKLK